MYGESGLLLIVSGASGAGKSTLCRRLLADCEDVSMSVSYTTRAPRGTEQDGVDYYFVSEQRFAEMVEAEAFAEHALVHGNRYGTARTCVEGALHSGSTLLFDVDYQGAKALRDAYPNASVSVMVLPPSISVLLARLQGRATDAPEVIQARMAKAAWEIAHFGSFDYLIINRNLETAYAELRSILHWERGHRRGDARSGHGPAGQEVAVEHLRTDVLAPHAHALIEQAGGDSGRVGEGESTA